ncbi:MAG: hypothetical protein ABFE01_29800 [Phycisphaerales bacterium]
MKSVTRKTVGVILVILGFAALVTPLSPGSWLILVGLEFLGLRILLENKLWQWIEKRPNSRISRVVRRFLCLRPRDESGKLKCEQGRKERSEC